MQFSSFGLSRIIAYLYIPVSAQWFKTDRWRVSRRTLLWYRWAQHSSSSQSLVLLDLCRCRRLLLWVFSPQFILRQFERLKHCLSFISSLCALVAVCGLGVGFALIDSMNASFSKLKNVRCFCSNQSRLSYTLVQQICNDYLLAQLWSRVG